MSYAAVGRHLISCRFRIYKIMHSSGGPSLILLGRGREADPGGGGGTGLQDPGGHQQPLQLPQVKPRLRNPDSEAWTT
jgi:hypothetical protein